MTLGPWTKYGGEGPEEPPGGVAPASAPWRKYAGSQWKALGGGGSKPEANLGGGGMPEWIKKPVRDVAQAGRELASEITKNPLKARAEAELGALGAVPRLGKRLVEAPVGLLSILAPEAGEQVLEDVRRSYGWDESTTFAPESRAGQLGAVGGDVALNFLQPMAVSGAASSLAGKALLPAAVQGLEGAGTQANLAQSVNKPGETPEARAHRIRMAGLGRGVVDVATMALPMSEYAKRLLTPAVALPTEAGLMTYAQEKINQYTGLPESTGTQTLGNLLTTLGTMGAGHVIGRAGKRQLAEQLEQAPIARDLGPGEAEFLLNPKARPTQEFQRARESTIQAGQADRIAMQGMQQRLKEKYSPEARAEAADILSYQEAGIQPPSPPTAETSTYLADPDFVALRKANTGADAGYFPRKVREGYGEEPVTMGERGALGRASTEHDISRKLKAFADESGNRIIGHIEGDNATLYAGGSPSGSAVKLGKDWFLANPDGTPGRPLKLGEAALPEIEAATPYRYERSSETVAANAALAQRDVRRTEQLKSVLGQTGMLISPADEQGSAAVQVGLHKDWPRLGHEYGELAGNKVHPELKEVLDSIAKETGSKDNWFGNINQAVLTANFQLNPTAHWKNEASHFNKAATGLLFRYPKLITRMGEISDRALLMEKSIRENRPTPEAMEYMRSGGVLMGGRGGRKYSEGLDESISQLLKREPREDMRWTTETSDRATWQTDDRARMMLYLMRMAGGETAENAVKSVNEQYPSYRTRIKPTGMPGLDVALDKAINNPMLVFQRYARGKASALASVLKKGASGVTGNLDDAREAIGNIVGMGINAAVIGGGLTAAVKSISGDERKKAGMGGGEHVLSDISDVATRKQSPSEFFFKQAQLSPAARSIGTVVEDFAGSGSNPEDVYDALYGPPEDAGPARKNLAKQTLKSILGASSQGVPGLTSSGDTASPFLSLLGAKRDYTPTEKQLSKFTAFQLPPSAEEAAVMEDRGAVRRATREGKPLGDIAQRQNLDVDQIVETAKSVQAGKASREDALGVAASKRPEAEIVRLLETAKDAGSDAEWRKIWAHSRDKLIAYATSIKGFPNKHANFRRRLAGVIGEKALADAERAAESQEEPGQP